MTYSRENSPKFTFIKYFSNFSPIDLVVTIVLQKYDELLIYGPICSCDL